MFSGTTEKIWLQSDVQNTKFYYGNRYLGQNTSQLIIEKKHLKNTRIVARKEGCKEVIAEVETEFDETSLLGLFIDFGIISILVVDWIFNGATTEAKKTLYTLNPSC